MLFKSSTKKTINTKQQKTPFLSGNKRIAVLLFFIFIVIFCIASLYTSWTGSVGEQVASFLLGRVGGAVVILLMFLLYISLSKLFSMPIPNLFRQFAGTAILFTLASMLLGFNIITGTPESSVPGWLFPGTLGLTISGKVFSSVGALGAFLIGVVSLYVSLVLYKIPIKLGIKLPKIFSAQFSLKKDTPDKSTSVPIIAESSESEEPAMNDMDEPDAPNIAEFDGDDYFGDSERTEADNPNFSLSAQAPSSPVEEAKIQDPSFDLSESDTSGISQGIFPPPIEIFGREESHEGEITEEKARPLGLKIITSLEQFNIEANLAEILVGPTVIQFRIQLAPGIKVNKVAALANDIALAMAVPSLRIEAPIPGKPYVGIEIPNPKRRGIPLRTVVAGETYQNTQLSLPLPFGVAVNGESVIVGLEELPHLLVAGTTGSGKSVFVNACIVGLCSMRTPQELRMVLVDPKRVEMAIYENLPHLLTPPVTDAKKAVHVLAWAIREMEKRYTTFARARVRNLEGFNEKVIPKDKLPHIVIVVDELADLMMTAPKEVEEYICRLAQMARATGIHLMLATQRPSVNVITGLIKANIPARVAFTLPSNADSRTIIDCAGAEKLLGKGDMLFLSTKHPKPIRIQSPWIDEAVLGEWLKYLSNLFGAPDFIEIDAQGPQNGNSDSAVYDDDMLEDAIDSVMSTGIASASGLQRRLRVGFSRASRLIDMMEQLGIVGPSDGARPREILVDEDEAQEILSSARGN